MCAHLPKIITGSNLIFVALLVSCDNSKTVPTEPFDPYDYYPLTVGSNRVYEITDSTYSVSQKTPIVTKWYEKDVITEHNQVNDFEEKCFVSRYSRNNMNEGWKLKKIFSVTATPDKFVENVDNQPIVSLVFPYSLSFDWDGFMFMALDKDDIRSLYPFHYSDLDQPYTIDSLTFKKTIKVVERDETDLVLHFTRGYRYYAHGVGLIYEEQTNYEYLQENGQVIGDRLIANGFKRVRKIIGYGK